MTQKISSEDEAALNRGAEAGWSLGRALQEIFLDKDKAEIAVRAAAAALVLVLVATTPADAHCYSRWFYPWKQTGCGATHAMYHPAAPPRTKTWFVEVTPPLPDMNGAPAPKSEKETDWRTPEEIKDQAEHDAAVEHNKSELNALIEALHSKENKEQK